MTNDQSHVLHHLTKAHHVLQNLAGVWEGQGQGFFPTITEFEYLERFELRWDRDVFIYMQSTEKRELGKGAWEPGHREYGFIHLFENRIEVNNCQNGGRAEWLSGTWKVLEDGFHCDLVALGFGNDPRMLRSKRSIHFQPDQLQYDLFMATGSCPELTHHLSSKMARKSR